MESTDRGENQSMLLISELSFIQKLVTQLEAQLREPSISTIELSSIVTQLLSKTENSIFLANSCGSGSNRREPTSPLQSASASPASGMSHSAFRCHDDNDDNNTKKEVSKKRKTLPRWRSQVKVGSTGGVEGPLDDGHSWRKYGQKDILGAKHPRGYYRCTYRNSQGCQATKQVQRTDDNPTVFDVIYQGTHTCINKSNARPISNISCNNNNNNNNNKQMVESSHDQDYLDSLKATLTIKTKGLGPSGLAQQEAQQCNSLSFSFPSTPIESSHVATMTDNYFPSGGFLPSLANSSATSESNYFCLSPCAISGYDTGVGGFGLRKVDSDLTEVVSALSATTSTTNSPMGDIDPIFDGLDFDTNFQIDTSSFFY
ncbi:putative WRKY transcription factor 53 [Carex littledalei]|uniref:Putative WRKY transcription factor 53 n=1 Tax=Carex littledalei TaxID=544730 RepID=A0A833VLN5_9POAL|nr:putative WRKY transcription factor 53 [Carex littledalei]